MTSRLNQLKAWSMFHSDKNRLFSKLASLTVTLSMLLGQSLHAQDHKHSDSAQKHQHLKQHQNQASGTLSTTHAFHEKAGRSC